MAVKTPRMPALSMAATRRALMRDRGLIDEDIVAWIKKERRGKVSRATVTAVLAGKWRNDDVEDGFCALTGSDRAAMFPAKPAE